MSVERSHGKARLMRPKLSRLPSETAEAEPRRDRDERGRFVRGNRIPRQRGAKSALLAPLRAVLEREVAVAGVEPSEAHSVARRALSLYRSGRRELGTDSPIALSHLARWAVGSAIGSRLTLLAAEAGLATEQGQRLTQLALAAEARAERASVAALTFARELDQRRPSEPPTPWLEPADEGDDDDGDTGSAP